MFLYFSLLTERAEMVLIRRRNIRVPKLGNWDKNSSPIFSYRIFRVLKMHDLDARKWSRRAGICVSAENTSDLRICISGAIFVNFGAAHFCVFEQKVDTGSEGIGRQF